jgi:hypothetical protein
MDNPVFEFIWLVLVAALSFRAGMEWQKKHDDNYRDKCNKMRYQM